MHAAYFLVSINVLRNFACHLIPGSEGEESNGDEAQGFPPGEACSRHRRRRGVRAGARGPLHHVVRQDPLEDWSVSLCRVAYRIE